ncbi:hypothetical protein HPP92_008915 [Vanilla planifolia]|uniref:Uncharacterized protein n=1 Tax=Vanilla planifolia TaxID=51239 RepID=A0A835V7N9_VANPL|nr:hypothetical protein HPP92_008915 [Vanilla planifolia]
MKPYFFFRNPYLKRTATIWPRKTSTITASSFFVQERGPPETGVCAVGSAADKRVPGPYQLLPLFMAVTDLRDYFSRPSLTGASFAILLGLPAAFGPGVDPIQQPNSSAVGWVQPRPASSRHACRPPDVPRLDLCGNRFLSATVEYEETGWYDGQTPEVLARDRLLGSFSCIYTKELSTAANKFPPTVITFHSEEAIHLLGHPLYTCQKNNFVTSSLNTLSLQRRE